MESLSILQRRSLGCGRWEPSIWRDPCYGDKFIRLRGELCRTQSWISFIYFTPNRIAVHSLALAAPPPHHRYSHPLKDSYRRRESAVIPHKYYHLFLATCAASLLCLRTGQTGRYLCRTAEGKTWTGATSCARIIKLAQTGLHKIYWWFIYLGLNRKSCDTCLKLPLNHHFKGHICYWRIEEGKQLKEPSARLLAPEVKDELLSAVKALLGSVLHKCDKRNCFYKRNES